MGKLFKPADNCYTTTSVHDSSAPALLQSILSGACVLTMKATDRVISPTWKWITHTLTIQKNKGFKDCKKDLPKNISSMDLIHAYYTCFRDHLNNQCLTTEQPECRFFLVFEDDFTVASDFSKHAHSILNFLQNNHANVAIYNLGPIVRFGLNSFDTQHPRSFLQGTSHAVLYHPSYIKTFIEYIENYHTQSVLRMKHVDSFHTILSYGKSNLLKNRYLYSFYTPVVYQLFPKTKNMKNWSFLSKLYYEVFIKPSGLHKDMGDIQNQHKNL